MFCNRGYVISSSGSMYQNWQFTQGGPAGSAVQGHKHSSNAFPAKRPTQRGRYSMSNIVNKK